MIPFPNKEYNIIYADPPWNYNKGVYQDSGRKDRQLSDIYKTMTIADINNMDVKGISNRDCALFLWVTDSHLKEGIQLIDVWGFTYRTIVFIWKKVTKNGKTCANVGAWTMKNCEICLLGVKGNMLKNKKANNIFQLVEAEREGHSRKPEEVRNRIDEIFGDLPRIELFAREKVEGWDSWGNEVE